MAVMPNTVRHARCDAAARLLAAFQGSDVTDSVPPIPKLCPYWGDYLDSRAWRVTAETERADCAPPLQTGKNSAPERGRLAGGDMSGNNGGSRFLVGGMEPDKKKENCFWLKLAIPPFGEQTLFVQRSPKADEGPNRPSHDLHYKGQRVGALWTKAKDDGEVYYTGKVLFVGWPGHELSLGVFARREEPGYVVSVQLPEREG